MERIEELRSWRIEELTTPWLAKYQLLGDRGTHTNWDRYFCVGDGGPSQSESVGCVGKVSDAGRLFDDWRLLLSHGRPTLLMVLEGIADGGSHRVWEC